MKNRSGEKIKMPTLDELMGISGEENANELEINRIPVSYTHLDVYKRQTGSLSDRFWNDKNIFRI